MKHFLPALVVVILLLSLAACGGASPSNTGGGASIESTAPANTGGGASTEVAPGLALNGDDTAFLNAIRCTAETECVVLALETSPDREPESRCAVLRYPFGTMARIYQYVDDEWRQTPAGRLLFTEFGCPQSLAAFDTTEAEEVTATQAAAPPTPTPAVANQIVGEPLPEGALEFNQCRPSDCTALVTEHNPNQNRWCVVLEQGGKREAWFFMNTEGMPPMAVQANTEAFAAASCTEALAMLEGT